MTRTWVEHRASQLIGTFKPQTSAHDRLESIVGLKSFLDNHRHELVFRQCNVDSVLARLGL